MRYFKKCYIYAGSSFLLFLHKVMPMAKLAHKNLFQFGSSSEVYSALQKDYNRDTWIVGLWEIVLIVCAIGGIVASNHADWLWIFGGLIATERAIIRFVDNSNRNWAMHVIDWMEAKRAHDNTEV